MGLLSILALAAATPLAAPPAAGVSVRVTASAEILAVARAVPEAAANEPVRQLKTRADGSQQIEFQ